MRREAALRKMEALRSRQAWLVGWMMVIRLKDSLMMTMMRDNVSSWYVVVVMERRV